MTAFLDIDLAAIAENWRRLDAMHPGETGAVLKADAYGLGAEKVAPVLQAAGCRHFFVAHLAEAFLIRPLVAGAVYVLHGLHGHDPAAFAGSQITPVLGSMAELAAWRAEARRREQVLPAVLHVDTGINRLGFSAPEMAAIAQDGARLEGIELAYVMSHLVDGDRPASPVNARQLAAFGAITALFPGVKRSLAASFGMFLGENFWSDLARPGAALYGINPDGGGSKNPIRDVVRLTAPILQVRELGVGETVGYNACWTAARPSRIAVLGVGYADGYHRALSNRAQAYFDGQAVPLVGRISMDLSTFDITDIMAGPGDRLELLGPAHGVDALAAEAGTNGYEILTSLGSRYARHYSGS